MKVAIIAAGSWGTALSMVLNDNGHSVCVWSKDVEQVEEIKSSRLNRNYLPHIQLSDRICFTNSQHEAVEGADMIVFSVPSQAYAQVFKQMVEDGLVRENVIVVNVSKGIDMETLETPSQMTSRIQPSTRFVVLSGPSHAEEVALKLPTALVSASRNRADAEFVQDAFSNDYMRVYTNPDVIGVEISGALKNIIAVGAGISDGLGFGDNAKAALITRGISEIAQLGIAIGAKLETFKGLAGVGDLIVTCTSMHSRNRRCGILIGEGKSLEESIDAIGMVVEGAYTIKSAYVLSDRYSIEMPITKELYRILYEGKNARQAVMSLMSRQRKHELDAGIDNWD